MNTKRLPRWGLILLLGFALAAAACNSDNTTPTSAGDTAGDDMVTLTDTSATDQSEDTSTTNDLSPADDSTTEGDATLGADEESDVSLDVGAPDDATSDGEPGDISAENDTVPDLDDLETPLPDATTDASFKPTYILDFTKEKLLISTLTGDIYKRLAVVGRTGIIRVNPTPAPHPGWTVGVIAEVRNESQGGLIFARPVRLDDALNGDFSLLADATTDNDLVLTFKMTVRDELGEIVQQSQTEPFSFNSGDGNQTVKTLIVQPEVSPGKITVMDSKDGQIAISTDKAAIDPYDSLVVVNLTRGIQMVFSLVDGLINGTIPGQPGDVLILMTFDSTNPDAKPSAYQQYIAN
ncbi:MAG: hypothetical protein KC609_26165 [Myxococcales bacterium]|nr:hypothetical protein [Myxococcales bacterium]